jgi:hypothetical protein
MPPAPPGPVPLPPRSAPSPGTPASRPLPPQSAPVADPRRSGLTTAPPPSQLKLPVKGGVIYNPPDAAGILALAISRPLTQADIDPVALPVLLRRVLARHDVFGTLRVKCGAVGLEMDLAAGSAALDKNEHAALMRAFEQQHGDYKLAAARRDDSTRIPHPLARLALDGLRVMLRQQGSEALEQALGERMRLAPIVREERRALPRRMGLGARELRFLDGYLDGSRDTHYLAGHGGIGRASALQLLVLLELFEVIEWREVARTDDGPSAADEVEAQLARLESVNYFEVLGVH